MSKITYTNEVTGLTTSIAKIDKTSGVIVGVAYTLIADDGERQARDARVINFVPEELKGPFVGMSSLTAGEVSEWIEAEEAKKVIDEETGETQYDAMKASLALQLAPAVTEEAASLPWAPVDPEPAVAE